MTAPSKLRWFKSSYSGGSGTECVECAYVCDGILVRDSKRDGSPVLAVQGRAWRSFTDALGQRSQAMASTIGGAALCPTRSNRS
ncbi:DUF397 domain-containing protein [Streptomyces ferrugineus]|uniref:DUF397 domain-containing protein n=1 Tax=Streptomyces ferrugineus TaxID=1413221 RepID=A0A7M2SNY5_9ACTN|nr:DUF397 domain-containing protein [Streptomyces ferrugineus]QOV38087.1 DUF397 domain-containing protein [Streptomyces ferrugineus]